MPKREVTSAPWVPVPARAYTGKAPRARQHRAVGRLSAGAPRLNKSCRWRRPGAAEGLTGQVPGVAAGRSNVARLGARGASGRMPLPRAGRPTARAVKASAPLQTAARRPLVVVVVAATPNYLRQASQNLGKYSSSLELLVYCRCFAKVFSAKVVFFALSTGGFCYDEM